VAAASPTLYLTVCNIENHWRFSFLVTYNQQSPTLAAANESSTLSTRICYSQDTVPCSWPRIGFICEWVTPVCGGSALQRQLSVGRRHQRRFVSMSNRHHLTGHLPVCHGYNPPTPPVYDTELASFVYYSVHDAADGVIYNLLHKKLSCRATLPVIEYFAKSLKPGNSLKVIRNHTVE